jgi:hypothetical protein
VPEASLEGALLFDSIFIHRGIRLSSEHIQDGEVVNRTCSPDTPQLIQATMVGDPAEPAPQGAAPLEFVDSLKCFEKHLLADVLGELAVAEDPEGKRGERCAIGGHQDLQRLVSSAAAYASDRCLLGPAIDARLR